MGLDLKGGMNVTLEVSVEDVIKGLSGNSQDPVFVEAVQKAKAMRKETQLEFVDLFAEIITNDYPNFRLTSVFFNLENKDNISRDASNEEVIEYIRESADAAFDNSFEVIRTRVNLFGVAQPNIQKLEGSDRILVELPGVKNKDRVRQLLQGTAKLEFWETYDNREIYPRLELINDKLKVLLSGDSEEADSTEAGVEEELIAETDAETDVETAIEQAPDTGEVEAAAEQEEDIDDLISQLESSEDEGELSLVDQDSTDLSAADQQLMTDEEREREFPLFSVLQANMSQDANQQYQLNEGPVVGIAAIKDTGKINRYLKMREIQAILPSKARLLWTAKPVDTDGRFLQLVAIKVKDSKGNAPLEGDVITDARQTFDQYNGSPEITMKMNAFGAKQWQQLTKANIGSSIAIVLDNYVYSFPTVQSEIAGGSSVIQGQFEIDEAQLIANILKAGKLPAPARIVEEAFVGPSLGEEAISSGLTSFLIALVIVLLYMVFYYNRAGLASNVALLANLFFLMGVLASTNIALTLPGIAGIVLTIGMSVDANVLIYERIREEMYAGKGIRLAVNDGYRFAYSSIIDANVTTILTGAILWYFGTGPVEGFAKTLVIGILTSLFSAIFITRLIFTWMMDKEKTMKFDNNFTKNAFRNMGIKFVGKRKMYYAISSVIIIAGLASLSTRGLNYGVDFQGGRSYLVRFVDDVDKSDVRGALAATFESET